MQLHGNDDEIAAFVSYLPFPGYDRSGQAFKGL